jgi:hypothetical protein
MEDNDVDGDDDIDDALEEAEVNELPAVVSVRDQVEDELIKTLTEIKLS